MDSSSSDSEVISAVLDGRRERFAEIVRRYRPALLRAAESQLTCRDLAEDAVQEAFLCAFKSLHTYDSRFSFRTWLWTILLNQCRRRWKRESRQPAIGAWGGRVASAVVGQDARSPAQALPSDEAGPEDRAMAREESLRLGALLDQLPEVQADALRLRFFGGLKFHEIADAMNCSLSSAKSRVRLGLTRLSELMSHAKHE